MANVPQLIYDPLNADEHVIVRIYAHPDKVTEDIAPELAALKAKGCAVVHQTPEAGDVEVEHPEGLMADAAKRLAVKRKNERVQQLQRDLLKELEGVTEESVAALVAAIRKSK